MWYCNILGGNNGIILHLLKLDPVTPGSILLTSDLLALKNENPEPILTVKTTEWRKFIDYFCLIIEADPSSVENNKVYLFHIGYIPSP